MKSKNYFLFFMFLFFQNSFSQDDVLKKLITNYKIEKNDSVKLFKVQKAFNYLEKTKKAPENDYIDVLEQLYLSQYDNYQDENAAKSAEKLFSFLKKKKNPKYNSQLSKTAYFINTTYDYLQNYTKAIEYNKEQYVLDKAIYGEKSEEVAKVHLQASVYYSRVDNVAEQIKSLDGAKNILENTKVKDKQLLFNMYQYYVITLIYYGDIPKAKTYLDKLNKTFEQNKSNQEFMNFLMNEDHTIQPNLFNYVLANVMFHKLSVGNELELKKTVTFFETYLKSLKKDLTNNDLNAINDFYCELGIHYTKLKKDYLNAQKSYDKAIAYNTNYPAGQIKLFYHKGWTDFTFKNWEKASISFEKCAKTEGLDKFIELISFYKNYGITLFHLNKNKESQVYLKKVEDFYINNSTYKGFMSLTNLTDVGNLYISIYKKNKDKVILKRSYTCFKNASKLFSIVYQGDTFNNNLSNRVESINKGLLYCSSELGDKKGSVLELVEKNKSDFLWASFLNKNQNKAFVKPKVLMDSIYLFENKKEQLSINLNNLKDKSEINKSKEKIKKIDENIRNNQNLLKQKYSSFYSFASNDILATDIQKKLTKDEILIDYVVLDSITYAFKVTNNLVELKLISKDNNKLKENCVAFYNKLKSIDPNFSQESQRLHDILIQPLNLPKNAKLILITNSFLSYLPFESLKNKSNFLVANYSISYANSIKLWNTQSLLPKNNNAQLVAFSPEYDKLKINPQDKDLAMLTRAGNYELVGAKKEALAIANLFNGTFYNLDKATKKLFLDNASKYQILHLAMHSIMNEEDENKSNLIFSNNEKLYFPEIYNLKIPADLAVLSACNTGVGNYKEGEGIMSVSRAFTYAGIKSTVVSLWQVPDIETSEIMISFYENLKKGQAKDQALANSKMLFIKNNPMKNHPFYWAGFVVNGDVSPIISNTNWMLYLAIGFGILALLFIFRKKLIQIFQ